MRKDISKKIVMASILMSMIFILTACANPFSKEEKKEEASAEEIVNNQVDKLDIVSEYVEPEEPEEEEEEEEDEETVEGMYRNELTNEWIDESLKDVRPIAAMIDNEKTALNHYGTNHADIIYEIMNSTENDRITRLMCLFKDYESIPQIGSIRSVRPTNFMLAAEYNAILCHDGGPFYIDEYIAKDYSSNFSGTFSRVKNGKNREFTEYILTGDMEKNFNNSNVDKEYNKFYDGPHFEFYNKFKPASEQGEAEEAKHVSLPFYHNSSELKYNEDTNTYDYYEYGMAHVDDGDDGKITSFVNVILQDCSFAQLDPNGYLVYNVIGDGKGYYLAGGEAIKIKWAKTSETGQTLFVSEDTGEVIKLNTGKTYIAIVPSDTWKEVSLN